MNEIIPAFIINRNLLTWPRLMVEWMRQIPYLCPIVYDNASTYAPLLNWYDTNPCQIIRMPVNTHHYGIFQTDFILNITTKYFIVSDPDFDMSEIPLDVIEKLKYGLETYTDYFKCGLAINIFDLPDEFPAKNSIINWEKKYWVDPLDDLFYKAHVDTTFALYDSSRFKGHSYEAIRIAGPYMARHLPWYITKHNLTDEFRYYCQHNEGSSTICSMMGLARDQ